MRRVADVVLLVFTVEAQRSTRRVADVVLLAITEEAQRSTRRVADVVLLAITEEAQRSTRRVADVVLPDGSARWLPCLPDGLQAARVFSVRQPCVRL